jgi:hypothetical protein
MKEVELHKWPRWLPKRIREAARKGLFGGCCMKRLTNWELIQRSFGYDDRDFYPTIWDHWGRCGDRLVTEPYQKADDPKVIDLCQKYANKLGLQFTIGTESTWNPGSTIRIEFWPSDTFYINNDRLEHACCWNTAIVKKVAKGQGNYGRDDVLIAECHREYADCILAALNALETGSDSNHG